MKPILPCLAFANAEQTEQAVRTYIDLFRTVFGHAGELARTTFSQAEIDTVQRLHGLPPDQLPGPAGAVKTIRFHLNGMELLALNGGGYFGKFHESFSLYMNCETQAQIDRLHEALSTGGEVQPCGWVKDRFGVSWQIVPDVVLAIDEGADRAAAERMNVALLGMTKLDQAPVDHPPFISTIVLATALAAPTREGELPVAAPKHVSWEAVYTQGRQRRWGQEEYFPVRLAPR